MAGLTPRFGWNFFGGNTEGAITDDGGKFTGLDRLDMDKILAAIEVHDYHAHAATDTTADAPTLQRLTTGVLEGGTTYFYKVSLVDQNGMEGEASTEVSISTPDVLTAPQAPSGVVLDTGTNPGNGVYYYALTLIRGSEESTLGDIETVTVLAGDGSVELTMPTVTETDATSFRIWRMGTNESGYTRVTVVPVSTTTWIDDGTVPSDPCPTDPDNQPPSANAGADVYSVQITLPAETIARLAGASAWRIYRTEVSGSYAADSLVHEVVERTDDLDPTTPLLTTWLDDGDELLTGTPKAVSQSLSLRPFTFESAGTLPDAVGYPENYPLIVDGTLYVKIGDWTAVTGGGGGGTSTPVTPWPDYIFTGADGRRWQQTIDATGAIVMVQTDLLGAPTPPQNVMVA